MNASIGLAIKWASQIHDDILNLIGEHERYGKEIGGHLRRKRTLMLVHLLNHCTEGEKEMIRLPYPNHRTHRRHDDVELFYY